MSALPARHNPFATERLDRLAYRDPASGEALGPAGLDCLVDRLESLGRRAAIVGPEGSGKTALLEALAPRLAERGWQVGWTASSRPGPSTFLLIDGEERLAHRGWRRLLRASRGAGGLLVTVHRPGPLPTLVESAASPELLAALMDELAGAAAPELPGAHELFARHRGNLRAALLELYDRCAER